ncbi:hypothetical protein RND81_07G076800 [Saponaria officinalis]|uniref:LisH domain-containing protein n=1 Tax=Saponaria officinalis TaxID=3572 RepID=A0AAW1JL14_SAPOF
MGGRSKGRMSDKNNNNNVIGKDKITPVQVAFIVDRYLVDNNFTQTRSTFRSEASSLISNSPLNQVPKSLMSLGELLEEYILLKEQKIIIEQEKCGLAQEKCRIQSLLYGMQNVMNNYNLAAAACLTPPPPPVSGSPSSMHILPSAGNPASGTHVTTSVSTTQCVNIDRANFRTPTSDGRPPRKRRNGSKDLEDAPQASKKMYSGPLANYPFSSKAVNAVEQPNNTTQGSSIAKVLFDKPSQSPTSNSSDPKTPPQAVSSPSEKSVSPSQDVSSTVMSHHNISPTESTPTNCTIISSKTIIVSPAKRYSIERNECTFSSPAKKRQSERNSVKGRLDFDSSDVLSCSTSESEKEGDIFDLDLTSLDAFGPDFSLNELLTEFGIDYDYSCPTTASASSDVFLDSLPERNNGEWSTSRDLIEHSSAMTDVVAANETVNGSDSVTSMKSVRKCIRIVSPTKSTRNSSVHCQENLCGSS